jgi:hypothetical protein
MANHLTPTELARESGLERQEVLEKCVELGVPVFHGRIDKSLFLASLDGPPEALPEVPLDVSARTGSSSGAAAASAA